MILEDAVTILRQLNYDEIADLCQIFILITLDKDGNKANRKHWIAPNPLVAQLVELFEGFSDEARGDFLELATATRDRIAPTMYRRTNPETGQPVARGTPQVKYVPRGKKLQGPYLYIRIWATGGDWSGKQKRLKNIYIGRKTLAVAFERGLISSDEIIDAFYAETLDELEAKAKGLLSNQ